MVMWKLTNVLLVVGVIVIGVILSIIILFGLAKFIDFFINEVLDSIKYNGIKKINIYILIIFGILITLIPLMIFFIFKLIERGVI